MTSIAQLIKASEYACTGRYPVQALAVFLNELIISLSLFLFPSNSFYCVYFYLFIFFIYLFSALAPLLHQITVVCLPLSLLCLFLSLLVFTVVPGLRYNCNPFVGGEGVWWPST